MSYGNFQWTAWSQGCGVGGRWGISNVVVTFNNVGRSFDLFKYHHWGCLNNPTFWNSGLFAVCWTRFTCHHELWPTSVSHPFSTLNSSLGLTYLLNSSFRHRSKKTSKLRVTGLCVGNSPVNSPHKWPVTWNMFPFDEVILTRKLLSLSLDLFFKIFYSRLLSLYSFLPLSFLLTFFWLVCYCNIWLYFSQGTS